MAAPEKRKRTAKEAKDADNVRMAATPGDTSQFVEGSIIRITMTNFLTYDNAVVHPGPNLNMIVGPNGTGKSSIVCAICLGLAGKTALLGRGDKVGAFVKHRCQKGLIEIVLYKRSGNVVVNREIYADNRSIWMLNGKPSNKKAVEDEIRDLQIQVGNLCQFLPQEKVGEFAKMSKVERLEATEKSVGPPEMYNFHCELKSFRVKERELENAVKQKTSFLENAKQCNERNKQDVKRYFEKKRHLDKISMLEKKKSWLEYESVRKEVEGLTKEREAARKHLHGLKEAQAPMLKKLHTIECRLKPIENQMRKETDNIKEAAHRGNQKQDQLDQKNRAIEDIKQALSLKQTEEADRQKRISNTRQMINDLKAELDKVGNQPDVIPRIEAINAELRQIQEEKARMEGQKADLRREKDSHNGESRVLTNRLKDMTNMMNAKEEKLKGRHKDTHTALQWLRSNKNLFAGNVHEPMMLVINVKDHRFAKYVENHISFNDLRAFVFQHKADMEKFMQEVRDKLNLRVNAISAPQESLSSRKSSRTIESLKRFGFFSYLREMFDAPEEVMSYLCKQYMVHDVPVGTNQTKDMIKTVIEEPYLKILYTSEERYSVKRSIYSNKTITSNSGIRPSQFLNIAVDAKEKNELQEKLRAREVAMRAVDEQLKGILGRAGGEDHRDNTLRAEKKHLSELKGKKRQLEQKISTKQDSLRQMEQGGIDLRKAEDDTKTKISAVNTQKVAIVTDLLAQMKRRAKLCRDKVYLSLETVGLTAEKRKLDTDCREGSAEIKEVERQCGQLEQTRTQLMERCKGLLKRARQISNMDHGTVIVPVELNTVFKELPNTVDEIDAMLNEERSLASFYAGLNVNVVEEYNKREQENKHLEKELGEKSEALNTFRQNISQAKENWLNPLKQLIDQINARFSVFFSSMQCAGEVDLHSEHEEEYDKYGIRIRVKFRQSDELHELTADRQSGGERSVSTMLYLMALQELNRCPFRVVDEINQGMDPVNERRVFDIVVRTACKETTSQYFFITPKLLQNLDYAAEMTILFIHNGSYCLPPQSWNATAFVRRRSRRKR